MGQVRHSIRCHKPRLPLNLHNTHLLALDAKLRGNCKGDAKVVWRRGAPHLFGGNKLVRQNIRAAARFTPVLHDRWMRRAGAGTQAATNSRSGAQPIELQVISRDAVRLDKSVVAFIHHTHRASFNSQLEQGDQVILNELG